MFKASLLAKEPSHSLPYRSPAGEGLPWPPFPERANVLSRLAQLKGLKQGPNPGVPMLTLCSPHYTWRCTHSWSLLRRPELGERQSKSFPQDPPLPEATPRAAENSQSQELWAEKCQGAFTPCSPLHPSIIDYLWGH